MEVVNKKANYIGISDWKSFYRELDQILLQDFTKNITKFFKYFHYEVFDNYEYKFDQDKFKFQDIQIICHKHCPTYPVSGQSDIVEDMKIINLEKEEEVELFTHYNYCKFKIFQVAKKVIAGTATNEDLKEAILWRDQSFKTREIIVLYNTRLIHYVYNRYWKKSYMRLEEFWSEALENLIQGIDSFEFLRSNKFSTYACFSLKRNFGRQYKRFLELTHIPTGEDVHIVQREFNNEADPYKFDVVENASKKEIIEKIKDILQGEDSELTREEKYILNAIYYKDMTLKEIGKIIGKKRNMVSVYRDKALNKIALAVT